MDIKKIGLLGGSFDPVHIAHTALADAAYHALSLDEVQLIPTARPWQRKPLSATAAQRLDLLNLAIAAAPYLRINPLEIERGGTTYTIDTLNALPENAEYYWILGSDQLLNFCTWHCWQDIAAQVQLAVANRPGAQLAPPLPLVEHLAKLNRSLITLPFKPMPISSSAIRELLAAKKSIHGLVDVDVEQYITQHKLYQLSPE